MSDISDYLRRGGFLPFALQNEWNATNQPVKERVHSGFNALLPLAQYQDDSVHLAWPSIVGDTIDAFDRQSHGPDYSHREDPLVIGGSFGVGGLAAGPEAGAVGAFGGRLRKVGASPAPIRAYHGTYNYFPGKFDAQKSELAPHFGTLDQANNILADNFNGGHVYPVDLDFQNVVDLEDQGSWLALDTARALEDRDHLRFSGLQNIVEAFQEPDRAKALRDELVKRGVDAIRYNNDYENPAVSYMAVRPGTVRSAITGETLFSNPKEGALAPFALSGQDDNPPPSLARFLRQ